MYLLSFHFVRTCVARTSERGLPLSLSRYFIDCGRFPTGGDEWGYDVTGTFFSSLLSLFLREDETNKEKEKISGIPCARSFWLPRSSSTRPLHSSLALLLLLPKHTWLVITMIKQCYRESYPLVLRSVWCSCDAMLATNLLLWSLSSASKTTFVVVLSREVGETFHRSTTGHRL